MLRRRDADKLLTMAALDCSIRQRLAQRVARGFVIAGRKPVTLRGMNRGVHARHLRARHVTLLDCRREEERLERGARLPLCLHRAIERARVKVTASDQRKHMAGARIESHERGLEVVRLIELRQPCGDRFFGVALHCHVDRCVNPQASLENLLGADWR